MTNYKQTMADALEFMYLMREYKLTERELTDAEKKKREEIAQDMDDADFKERYGDRWKEVKMAVATKQAKEEVELDEEGELDESLSGDVKKWFAKKGLKGIKVKTVLGKNSFMQVSRGSNDKIPNDIIKKAITLQYDKVPGSVRDPDNIEYGNFGSRMFSLSLDKMAELVKEEVDLDEAEDDYTIVAIKNNKVVDQQHSIAKSEFKIAIKLFKKNNPGAKISIEDKGGKIVHTEEVDLDEDRQLKNPKKEVLVVKGGKVIVINKKDAKEYLNKGWDLAEEVELDEGRMKDAMMKAQEMIDDGASDRTIMNTTKLSAKDVKSIRKSHFRCYEGYSKRQGFG